MTPETLEALLKAGPAALVIVACAVIILAIAHAMKMLGYSKAPSAPSTTKAVNGERLADARHQQVVDHLRELKTTAGTLHERLSHLAAKVAALEREWDDYRRSKA